MQAVSTHHARNAFLLKVIQIVALVAICLAGVDFALRSYLPGTKFFEQPIDIQSPNMLNAKLEAIQRFQGTKIIVLGDSLAFGRAMRDHGDKEWQNNTLAAQLQRALESKYPGRPIMVANLGMNGVVPADLDQLVRIVLPLKPDLILFDLSLRSFSRDFEEASARMSRPWLANFTFAPGTFKPWYLLNIKDVLQGIVFDGQPVLWVTRMRDSLDNWFKGGAFAPPQGDEFILLMKAHARYARIDLAADNVQAQALESTLVRLKQSGQAAIGFYATENKDTLEDLLDMSTFKSLQSQLAKTMAQGGKNVQWVGPLSIYAAENYLDHVHLNQEGYARFVARILPKIEQALPAQNIKEP